MGFEEKGYTSTVYEGNVLMFGRNLIDDNNQCYGKLFVMVPQGVLKSFYKDYNGNANQRIIINDEGIVVSSENSSFIGMYSKDLIDTVKSQAISSELYSDFSFNNKDFAVISVYVPVMHFYIADIIDREDVLKESDSRNNIIMVGFSVSFVVLILVFVFLNQNIKPIYKLVNHMSTVSPNNITETIEINGGGYEIKELTNAYNIMISNVNNYIYRLMEEQDKRRKAEINMLQMQINPHFIYNTLTSIKWLTMQNENEKAIEALERFSILLRNTIKNPKIGRAHV